MIGWICLALGLFLLIVFIAVKILLGNLDLRIHSAPLTTQALPELSNSSATILQPVSGNLILPNGQPNMDQAQSQTLNKM
jgi:hypothetical protein